MALWYEFEAVRKAERLAAVGRDFQRRSRLRRVLLRTLRYGENQGLDLGDCTVLVMSGAWLLRMLVRVEL